MVEQYKSANVNTEKIFCNRLSSPKIDIRLRTQGIEHKQVLLKDVFICTCGLNGYWTVWREATIKDRPQFANVQDYAT